MLPAERGAILDRNGAELAISVRRQTVWADPKVVRDPAGAARALAPVLGLDEQALRDELSDDVAFVYLARKVEDDVADTVEAPQAPRRQFLLEEPKRYRAVGRPGRAGGRRGRHSTTRACPASSSSTRRPSPAVPAS